MIEIVIIVKFCLYNFIKIKLNNLNFGTPIFILKLVKENSFLFKFNLIYLNYLSYLNFKNKNL